MRRRTLHGLFGLSTLICGALALYSGLQLAQAANVNRAIASAEPLSSGDATLPHARFAAALKSAQAGDANAALSAYKALSQSDEPDLRLGALYNLGNLHLREALQEDAEDFVRSLPLIELAKQRYREVLRQRRDYWDARYNLELALALAPEADDPILEEDEPTDKEERVISTLPGTRIDLP